MITNTVILSLDGLVDKNNKNLEQFNIAFTYIFTFDMSLKIFGLGIREYIKDKMNIFDTAIVILSLIEHFVFGGGGSAMSSIRILRIFRVLRVSRVIR